MKGLAIKDVAERTGIAAGTIRMWEQRYGFPEPERTTAGYRLYSEEDVEALRRVLALRERGLSVPAAVERARGDRHGHGPAVAVRRARRAATSRSRSQLLTQADAARDLARDRGRGDVARGGARRVRRLPARAQLPRGRAPLPRDGAHRRRRRRVRRLRRACDAREGEIAEVPLEAGDALGNEWAVVIDAPGYSACLLAWEHPRSAAPVPDRERTFETLWTLDPRMVRRAAEVGASLARRADEALGARIEGLLADRPLAMEHPAPSLTSVTNRIVGYLDADGLRDADRADAVRVRQAELLGGRLGEIPARLGAERPAIDDRERPASATRSARRRSSHTGGCGGRRRRARASARARTPSCCRRSRGRTRSRRRAVDGQRQLGRDGGALTPAADHRAEAEHAGVARAPAGEEGAVGLDGCARLLRPRQRRGVEVLDDHRAAGEASLDGAAEAHLAAEQRVAAAGELRTARAARPRRGRARRARRAPARRRSPGAIAASAARNDTMRVSASLSSSFSGAYEVS